MRPIVLVEQAFDLITRHPPAAAGLALVAAGLSWLLTRTRSSV